MTLEKPEKDQAFSISKEKLKKWLKQLTDYDFIDKDVIQAVQEPGQKDKNEIKLSVNTEFPQLMYRRLKKTSVGLIGEQELKI